jgi:O-antigen/teichoic acid export membrane protein
MYLAQVFGLFLTGIGDARATFQVQIYGAGSSLVLGLPLAAAWGAVGACAGMLVVNATKSAASAVYAFARVHVEEEIQRTEPPLGQALSPAALQLKDC